MAAKVAPASPPQQMSFLEKQSQRFDRTAHNRPERTAENHDDLDTQKVTDRESSPRRARGQKTVQRRDASPPAMPPRWKTAVVVWLAIYPSITLILWLTGPTMQSWPLAVRTLVVTLGVVPLMVFVLIPAFQRLMAPWLRRT
jgi:antibiotic biosynthesis monooxygenase (ABM) superfamily enzyme